LDAKLLFAEATRARGWEASESANGSAARAGCRDGATFREYTNGIAPGERTTSSPSPTGPKQCELDVERLGGS
jgi:hypothetical protein